MDRQEVRTRLLGKYFLATEEDVENSPLFYRVMGIVEIINFILFPNLSKIVHVFIHLDERRSASTFKINHDYVILLNAGALEMLEGVFSKFYSIESLPQFEDVGFHSDDIWENFIAFILIHEYQHIANGHLEYVEIHKDEIEKYDWYALEYDADCCAAANTLNFVRLKYKGLYNEVSPRTGLPVMNDVIAKGLLFCSIYYGIRYLATNPTLGLKSGIQHPSFFVRLKYTMHKVIMMFNHTGDGNTPADPVLFGRTVTCISNTLKDLEVRFNDHDTSSEPNDFINFYANNLYNEEFTFTLRKWEEISGEVRRLNHTV